MEPRTEIEWISADAPLQEVLDRIVASGHSRFPLCGRDLDDIIGVVQVKDVLELVRKGETDLRSVAGEPLFVGEGVPALRLLELFRTSGLHLALVVDEYGTIDGLATPTDILTSIAGELPELGGEDEPTATERDDGSWLMDGSLPIDRATDILGLRPPPYGDYATLAGLILEEMGRIPEPGEWVETRGWRFEVMDMDGRRIDKLLACLAAPAEPRAGENEG
jgi:putative hemolysin